MERMNWLPSSKEIRYDRQLRLWGDKGQVELEKAHVCILNASAIGSEILKSLVLPGIGSFTIFDDHIVDLADMGTNFFVSQDSIGLPRAQVLVEAMKELNCEVKGEYRVESGEEVLSNNMAMLELFTVVIGTNLDEKTACDLSDYLWTISVPFIHARCYGLLGYVRICKQEHAVVDTHSENSRPDLRLNKPFAALQDLARSTNFNQMSYQEHSHTPYLLLFMKALERWKDMKKDETRFPKTYEERKEVKELLLQMRRVDDKGRLEEENFAEAGAALARCLQPSVVPESLLKLFADEKCQHLTEKSSNFWILCNCLSEFVSRKGQVPLSGVLPDMTSDSSRYVTLSGVYREEASRDWQNVLQLAQRALTGLGRPLHCISVEQVAHFCKNAVHLTVIRGSRLVSELASPPQEIVAALEGYDPTVLSSCHPVLYIPAVIWYVLLRCCDRFQKEKGRYPGTNGVPCALDRHDLRSRIFALFTEWKIASLLDKVAEEAVEEMCRYGAGEVHAVAALIGGIVAQETIKLITCQYIPLDNTFIYDGHTGHSATFQL